MVSTAKVSKYLKGIHFPADKRQCVSYAREHNAPDDVVGALNSMPDNQFRQHGRGMARGRPERLSIGHEGHYDANVTNCFHHVSLVPSVSNA